MKKILFISYAMPPLLYPQSIQIGRFLKYLKSDYDISVLTAEESGGTIDEELYPDIYDDINNVIKIKNYSNVYFNYIKNKFFPFFYQRPDIFAKWMNKAYNKIIKLYQKNDFDLILTFAQPFSTNILGRRLKKYFNCRWIAHNSDPWVDNPHYYFSSYIKKINFGFEKECFETSDTLLFTCFETAKFYKKKYEYLKDRIDFINHSYDATLYENKTLKNEKPICRYIGSFYGIRSPIPLFNAVKRLNKDYRNRFEVELIGGGIKVKNILGGYQLDNIVVKPYVSYMASLDLMKMSDILFIIDAPSDYNIFFPSKLADYIGARTSILGISPPGTSDRILKELGFKCHNPIDASMISSEIKNFIEGGYSDKPNQNYKKYSIEHNILKFKKIINEL